MSSTDSTDKLLSNIDKLPKLSEDQILRLLTVLPYKIEELANKINTLETLRDEVKADLKVKAGQAQLDSIALKQSKELLSEGDRKAWVAVQKDVIKAETDLIHAEYNLRAAEIIYERYVNTFVAARKIASLINESNNAQGMSQKYL